MRSQFLLFPAALIASAPAQAYHYQTATDAQALLFPGATFAPEDFTMTIPQVAALMSEIDDGSVYSTKIKAWKVSTGGWVFLDQVIARLHVRLERLQPSADPTDWSPDPLRRPKRQSSFSMGDVFAAETAADIVRDEMDSIGIYV